MKKNINSKIQDLKYILQFFKEDFLIFIFHIILGIICAVLVVLSSFFLGEIINILLDNNDFNEQKMLKILYGSLITISLYFIYWILNSKIFSWTIKLSYRSSSKIRYAVFTKLLNVPISYIDRQKVGELMARATNDIDIMISSVVQASSSLFTSPIIIIGILIINTVFSPLMSLIAVCFSILTLLASWIISKKSSPDFEKTQKKLGHLSSLNKEFIKNQMVTYVFRRQETIKQKYKKVNNSHMIASYKAEYKIGLVYPVVDIIENIIYGSLTVIGMIFIVAKVPMGGAINFTIGSLTTFVLLNRISLGEIGTIAKFASVYEKLFQCIKRINEVLKESNDIDLGTLTLKNLNGNISFKNVNFSYDGKKPIIQNFNLDVKKGQVVGIVGPTGSGKSTITNLLMRFYEPNSGTITIDGIDIKNIKKQELRKYISIVPQETNLFSESVYTNISYGNHSGEINKEKIVDAARHIGSEHFINVMPNGFETILDENISISAGESQMLALTRAYYSPSSIMILDEATSSIDSKTEQDIQIGMNKLMKDKTSFIVAHRLSTIKNADIIIVLKDGKIIEQGNHDELIQNNKFYAKLYFAKNTIDN